MCENKLDLLGVDTPSVEQTISHRLCRDISMQGNTVDMFFSTLDSGRMIKLPRRANEQSRRSDFLAMMQRKQPLVDDCTGRQLW